MKIKKYLPFLLFPILIVGSISSASAANIANADFESGDFTEWDKGSQTGVLGSLITGSGSGVSIIDGSVTFNAPPGSEVGTPGTEYYQPPTNATAWVFSPYGDYGAALQPASQFTFDNAISSLGLSAADNTAMKQVMSSQASASGWGSGNPTDAAWITKDVSLEAGTLYTMSWNYIGTDYVPFNDGSITSLVFTGSGSTPDITVNNQDQNYALLGFTNPGTGDYSTGTYGSTGWQISTYEVSVSGTYRLGFAVFNLDDTALSPVLLIDSQPGSTTKNGEDFGAVTPNNSDAPTVPPTTETPVETDPPTTTVETDPPSTDVIEETTTTVEETTTTIEVTTTTEIEETTTTEVEQVTTTRPRETTTEVETTVIETTVVKTTVVDTTITDNNTTSDTMPIGQLPKTGSDSNIFIMGSLLIFFGLFIINIRKWLNI
jgi:hypothetical protein